MVASSPGISYVTVVSHHMKVQDFKMDIQFTNIVVIMMLNLLLLS